MMRQVLVDSARGHKAQKRGDGERFRLSEAQEASFAERPHAIVALDEALSELAKIDERKCKVIEMEYFGGLTNQEMAEVLGVSVPTIVRDKRLAEA